ncbi:MAG: AMP-binding protein [Planctomycetota bacterium]|nr:AMP-binding protein [Planctomycetota bacterium]
MSLLHSILGNVLRHPRRTAVIDDRREYTYAQLAGAAMFLAQRIEQTSAAQNVGILLPTSGAVPVALLGCWLAGRTAVPFNFLLNKDELAYVIANSEVDTIIAAGPLVDFMGGPSVLPPGVKLIRMEEMDYTGMPPLRWPPLKCRHETAVILYTSGTSGRPKGVMLTHDNLEANARGGIAHAKITDVDIFLGVLPQFHSFGLTALTIIPLLVGARVVYASRFTPRSLVEMIRKHRPEIFMAVPSMYGVMLGVKDTSPDDFKSIRLAISGGEALPRAMFDEFRDRLGLQLLEGYGLTETSPVTHWSTPWALRPGAVGTQLPRVRTLIVDAADRPLGVDAEGEILVSGPNIMKGYYRLPEETAKVMTTIHVPGEGSGGPVRCFRTGDIGKIDAQGFLYITGRKKEMFKVAGEMVAPREVEEVLNQHPSVKGAAVVPKPDGTRGEVPLAFVEINDGQTFDEAALKTWCRERLAGFKVPKEVRRIDALPRNATGKILRRELKVD